MTLKRLHEFDKGDLVKLTDKGFGDGVSVRTYVYEILEKTADDILAQRLRSTHVRGEQLIFDIRHPYKNVFKAVLSPLVMVRKVSDAHS